MGFGERSYAMWPARQLRRLHTVRLPRLLVATCKSHVAAAVQNWKNRLNATPGFTPSVPMMMTTPVMIKPVAAPHTESIASGLSTLTNTFSSTIHLSSHCTKISGNWQKI